MGRIRTLSIAGVLACSAVLASCAQSARTAERPPAQTHTVIMEGMAFMPAALTVSAGDRIVWINKDLVPHNATSTAAGFDSKIIEAGKSWRYTADRKGDFDYVCSFHPGMVARLHVQ
jgi:plastocyanin